MKIIVTSFKRSHAHTAALSAPTLQQATTNPHLCWSLLDTHGHVWVSFLCEHCSFLLGSGAHTFVGALQGFVSPVLCKFWWFLGGVNGNLFQEGLCHTQVCSTQSPWPCGRPLLIFTFTGNTQTQFWLSLLVGHAFCALPRSEQLRRPGAWPAHCPR